MARARYRGAALVLGAGLIIACGSGGEETSEGDAGTPGDGEDTPGRSSGDPATGWGGAAATPEPESPVELPPSDRDCPAGATGHTLPETDVEFCLAADAACQEVSSSCPLVVTFNTEGAFFSRVGAPGGDPVIVAELFGPRDGNEVKDQYAEVPRLLATVFPGLDRDRVHAIGWSAGAGTISRGLCHIAKQSDGSAYGSTSDIYASLVALGGCGCANDYQQLSGNYHVMTFNGTDDIFGGEDSCEEGLRERAAVNGCEGSASWEPLPADDPYAEHGTGSSEAERLVFTGCTGGDVVGYRGRDEGHVLSFKKSFDPKISGYDAAWAFIQDKSK